MNNTHMVTYKRLVKRHLALVSKTAEQFIKENTNIYGLTEEDLLSAGYEGLVAAAHTYDASREASFKTYAMTYIKNAMLDEIMYNINYEHKKLLKDPTIGLINIGRNTCSLTKQIIMGIIDKENALEHPNGKIKLLNGTVLDCYPLEQPEDKTDNAMKLDTIGTYLVVGGKKPAEAPRSDEEKEEEEKLFLSNAFRFLRYRDRIMSDSRMFLCPVPIQNGIAYTGTSGFHNPTLGVYLEWWLNCESALVFNGIGKKKLVYQIAGSPLSGSNRCGVVDENGKTETESIYPFSSLWPNFMRINSRYDEAKSLYQAYTLKQVVDILGKESLSLIDDMELENIYLRSELYWKTKDMPAKIQNLEDMIGRLNFRLFYAYRDDLKAIMAIYDEKKEKKEQREKEIDEECKELRRQLKSGEIDNKQYQKRLTPLKKEKENNIYLLREYRRSALEPLFPDLGYTISDVEAFFKDPRSEGPLKSSKGRVF